MYTKTVRTPATPGVLDDPVLNRGAGFTATERAAVLGLTGRVPVDEHRSSCRGS